MARACEAWRVRAPRPQGGSHPSEPGSAATRAEHGRSRHAAAAVRRPSAQADAYAAGSGRTSARAGAAGCSSTRPRATPGCCGRPRPRPGSRPRSSDSPPARTRRAAGGRRRPARPGSRARSTRVFACPRRGAARPDRGRPGAVIARRRGAACSVQLAEQCLARTPGCGLELDVAAAALGRFGVGRLSDRGGRCQQEPDGCALHDVATRVGLVRACRGAAQTQDEEDRQEPCPARQEEHRGHRPMLLL